MALHSKAVLSEVLDGLVYVPSKADSDVYLRPVIKSDGFKLCNPIS